MSPVRRVREGMPRSDLAALAAEPFASARGLRRYFLALVVAARRAA